MKNHRMGHGRQAERPRRKMTTTKRIERHRKAIAMGFCDKLPRRSLRSVNIEVNARHDMN